MAGFHLELIASILNVRVKDPQGTCKKVSRVGRGMTESRLLIHPGSRFQEINEISDEN